MEPQSLGRVAFGAWMAGEVIQHEGNGRYRMIRPTPSQADQHWAALQRHERALWERIGEAVRERVENLGETYLIEVD